MKGIDILCTSQASTAICMSMDQPSSSSSSSTATIQLGGRAIDRHNPIIRDHKRAPRTLPLVPCTSQPPPINPKPYHLLQKPKKSSSNSKANDHHQVKKSSSKKLAFYDQKAKKGSSKPSGGDGDVVKKSAAEVAEDVASKSWAKASEFITPPGSSRYLLSDAGFFDGLSDYDPVLALVPVDKNKSIVQDSNRDEAAAVLKPSNSSSRSEKPSDQVVVLRVSLHCKGCEGKLRKHLSRMQGVQSFNIDFAAKKVTVVGDVTPLSVLASVSKVKNAQFWTAANATANAAAAASASASASSTSTEVQK